MKTETALKILPYCDSDSSVMEVVESTNFDLEACQAALALIESEPSLFTLLAKTNYDLKLCMAALEHPQINIPKLLSKADQPELIKAAGTALRLAEQVTSNALATISEFPKQHIPQALECLNLKEKSFSLQMDFLNKAEIYDLPRKYFIPLIDPKGLKEKELLEIIRICGYPEELCRQLIPHFIKSPVRILQLIYESDFAPGLCLAGISRFNIDEPIMLIIKQSRKCELANEIALAGLKKLKEEENILSVMEKSGFDPTVCAAGISRLKTQQQIINVLNISDFHHRVCEAGAPLINFDQLLKIEIAGLLTSSRFDLSICQRVWEISEYNDLLLLIAQAYPRVFADQFLNKINLEILAEEDILELIQLFSFDEEIVSTLILFLEIEGENQAKLFTFLEKTDYNDQLGQAVADELARSKPPLAKNGKL